MLRPDYITSEMIREYDARIDNDPLMNTALAQNPIIREVCYAGQFLVDKLTELGCPDLLIGRIMYTAGKMCFGRKDPWAVHQDILSRYVDGTLEFEAESDDLN